MSSPAIENRVVTAGQASIFFAEQRRPPGAGYNGQLTLEVRGDLTVAAAEEACRALLRASAALRLRLEIDAWTGELVHAFSSDPPEIETWDLIDPARSQADADEIVRRAFATPFDIEGGPLVRFVVVRMAPDRATITMILHHLVSDGASQFRYARLLARCVRGAPVGIGAEAEREYERLVQRTREAEARALRQDEGYWADRLNRVGTVLPWTSRSGSAGPLGGSWLTGLAPAMQRLRGAGAGSAAGLFLPLVAAVQIALRRHGAVAPTVSVAASLRLPGGDLDDVPGCFVNQVPLTSDESSAGSVTAVVAAQAAGWREDLRRRAMPFARLVALRRSAGADDAGRLDSVMVTYRKGPMVETWSDDLYTYAVDHRFRNVAAKADLTMRFFHDATGVECSAEWSQDVGDALGAAVADEFRSVVVSG